MDLGQENNSLKRTLGIGEELTSNITVCTAEVWLLYRLQIIYESL